jgi:hypothetical protein
MASSTKPVNVSRKLLWLGASVFAVCGLYSAAWFAAASKGEDWLKATMAKPTLGITASCPGMEVKGFPFRVGVFCSTSNFSMPQNNIDVAAGALRTMALIYNPGKVVFEIDGPAKSVLPNGMSVVADWKNLNGSLGASLSGLNHLSTFYDQSRSEISGPMLPGALQIETRHGEFHTRQNGNNLDIAALAEDNVIKTSLLPAALPKFSVSIDGTLDNLAGLLNGQHLPVGASVSGNIQRLALDFGSDGFVTLSGPFQISPDGYLSGDFELSAENFSRLQPLLRSLFPDQSAVIDATAIMLKSLSKDGTKASIKLTVASGTILFGMIPIGVIPPL